MSDLNKIVTKLAEAARHVILTGEGITQLDEALSEYDKFSELADDATFGAVTKKIKDVLA